MTFTSIATATADKILSIVSGDGQAGVMETMLSEPLVVKVTDSAEGLKGRKGDSLTVLFNK